CGAGGGGTEYAEERLRNLLAGGDVLCLEPHPEGPSARRRRQRRPERWREATVEGGDVAAALEGRRALGVLLDGFEAVVRSAWPHDEERAEGLALEVTAALRGAAGMLAVLVSREAGLGPDPDPGVDTQARDRLAAANR